MLQFTSKYNIKEAVIKTESDTFNEPTICVSRGNIIQINQDSDLVVLTKEEAIALNSYLNQVIPGMKP